MAADVIRRLGELRQSAPALRLYALVDGVQYQQRLGEFLRHQDGMFALFDGTADAALAHAGPWLVDAELADAAIVRDLGRLERTAPAVSWLIAPQDLNGLAQLLQLRIDMRLPDGRAAILRFWDPRVLVGIAQVLDESQRETFFEHIQEWHLLNNGRRTWIGRHHADAQ